jgi:hypothetical protein
MSSLSKVETGHGCYSYPQDSNLCTFTKTYIEFKPSGDRLSRRETSYGSYTHPHDTSSLKVKKIM